MKRIMAREEMCIGCRLCEVYCIAAHSRYRNDIVKAFKKIYPKPVSRIIVEEQKPISFGLQCRHCDEPACVGACLTGAMAKDPETGIVSNDTSKCIGCWTCLMSCPYGVIIKNEAAGHAASQCDFCIENGMEPACVRNCPNEALYIKEAGDEDE